MNILLWVLQVLLALAFFAHGCLFLFPPAAMVEMLNASLPRWFQLFLGVAEVLAAIGLTLPGLTRIQPWLVSCAAAGVMIVMICATIFHVMRGESELSHHHTCAARGGNIHRVHALASRADPAPKRGVGICRSDSGERCRPALSRALHSRFRSGLCFFKTGYQVEDLVG
jgi:uncharacterized membrane protein YphA (DoxX/SURF4 family)